MSRSVIKLFSFSLCISSLVFIFSSFGAPNSYALMHDYDTIPAVRFEYVTKNGTFGFESLKIYSLDNISPRQRNTDRFALMSFNSDNYTCSGRTLNGRDFGRMFTSNNGKDFYADTRSIVSVFPYNENSFTDYCLIYSGFGEFFNVLNDLSLHDTMPRYTGDFSLYNKYRLPYDHIYLSNSLTIDGVVKNFNLRSSDLTDYDINYSYTNNRPIYSVSEIIIPFDEWNDNIGGRLINGRHLEYRGQIYFKNGAGKVSENYGSGAFGRVAFKYLDSAVENNSSSWNYINGSSCLFTHTTTEEDYILDYSCPIDIDVDLPGSAVVQPYLRFSAGSGCTDGCYLWKFTDDNVDWYFNSTLVITDYDETPGPVISQPCFGSECSSAPGAGSDDINNGSDDWFSSIVNMFRFNLINPFLPIFNMFTTGGDCVQIPTIAGMLGSEETTYCPWFDTTTRNILTPVMSAISVMLVFGFFVKWLGSSSGNFFEDSGGVDSPGGSYHFENKYHGVKYRNRSK